MLPSSNLSVLAGLIGAAALVTVQAVKAPIKAFSGVKSALSLLKGGGPA